MCIVINIVINNNNNNISSSSSNKHRLGSVGCSCTCNAAVVVPLTHLWSSLVSPPPAEWPQLPETQRHVLNPWMCFTSACAKLYLKKEKKKHRLHLEKNNDHYVDKGSDLICKCFFLLLFKHVTLILYIFVLDGCKCFHVFFCFVTYSYLGFFYSHIWNIVFIH